MTKSNQTKLTLMLLPQSRLRMKLSISKPAALASKQNRCAVNCTAPCGKSIKRQRTKPRVAQGIRDLIVQPPSVEAPRWKTSRAGGRDVCRLTL